MKERNLKASLVKPFKNIHRGKILKILRACRISELLVAVTRLLYIGTKAKILSPDRETDLEFYKDIHWLLIFSLSI